MNRNPLFAPRAIRCWRDAVTKAIFQNVAQFDSPPTDLLGIKRTAADSRESAWMSYRSAKLRRGVLCESGAELEVFSWLEHSPEVRWYQEQPVAVPYTFKGEAGLYYPDVAVLDSAGRVVVVEVKPLYMMYRQDALAKAVAALKHFGPRGVGYLMVDPRGRTLADLVSHDYDAEVAETVESLFVHGPVSFRLVRNSIWMRSGRCHLADFASLVVNRDWGVTNPPGVRIWRLPDGLTFAGLCGLGKEGCQAG